MERGFGCVCVLSGKGRAGIFGTRSKETLKRPHAGETEDSRGEAGEAGAEAGLFLPRSGVPLTGACVTVHHAGPGLAPQAEDSLASIQDAKNLQWPTFPGHRAHGKTLRGLRGTLGLHRRQLHGRGVRNAQHKQAPRCRPTERHVF